MKIKEVTEGRSRHKLAVELLFGILMLGCVFMIATNEDMRSTETRLSGIVSYINEQCNGYNRMNLASETKSLMRVMEGARQTEENLFRRSGGRRNSEAVRRERISDRNPVAGSGGTGGSPVRYRGNRA